MGEEEIMPCKITGCTGTPKKGEKCFVKGFCWSHYKQHLKGNIDILGNKVLKRHRPDIGKDSFTVFPNISNNYRGRKKVRTGTVLLSKKNPCRELTVTKIFKYFFTAVSNSGRKTAIYLSSFKKYYSIKPPDTIPPVPMHILKRVSPKIKCKIIKCEKPQYKNSDGFCYTHYKQYINKNIDINGNRIFCKIALCHNIAMARGFCLSHYRQYKKGLYSIDGVPNFIRIENECKKTKEKHELNKFISNAIDLKNKAESLSKNNPDLSGISSSISNVYNSKFIMDNIGSLYNGTIKKLMQGEDKKEFRVNIGLSDEKDTRNFTGILYIGSSSLAVTQYEIKGDVKEKSDKIFHLKDIHITSLPIEHSITGADDKQYTLKISEIPSGKI